MISMFILILSSVFLLGFTNSSLIPKSVFKLILLNNSSVCLNREQIRLPLFSSDISLANAKAPLISGGLNCGNSCSAKYMPSTGQNMNNAYAPLKVFMYDLPPDFHFGLLGWKGKPNQTWPNVNNPDDIPPYPGGLNLQHSMEYWLTMDLLASNISTARPCSIIRVKNSSQANVVFVPFFSSVSYNRHSKLHRDQNISLDSYLQNKLVEFLMSQDEWKRLGGKDHLIVAHHPNSMLHARKKLGSAMFVLADFGRYPTEIANLQKDIIAPYKHIVKTISAGQSAPFHKRPILAYFQGAIYRKDGGIIRQELYYLLKDEKDVHFAFGTVQGKGVSQASRGMGSAKFCLHIAGDTPSSNRLFDAIVSHCVPVIISDDIELPFEDVLDYSEFCIFIRAADAVKNGYILNLLRGISKGQWTKMWKRLTEVLPHYEYQFPAKPGDAVDMIWEAVSRKISSMQFKLHRKNRYRSQLAEKSI